MSVDPLESSLQRAESSLTEITNLTRHRGKLTPGLLTDALDSLAVALEEVHVLSEELREQNETLAAARQTVDEERSRYKGLFDSAPDALLITDPLGVIKEANVLGSELLGVPADRLVGKPLVVFLAPEDRVTLRYDLEDMRSNPATRSFEVGLTPRGGGELRAALTVFPELDAFGNPHLLRWLVFDITERSRTMQSLERALDAERLESKRLEALNQIKAVTLRAVAHDLRNPATSLLGFAMTLDRRDVRLDAEQAHFMLERIIANSKKINKLLDDLVGMDRLAEGFELRHLEGEDIGEVVTALVYELDISSHEVVLAVESVLLQVDRSKIERIVENLLLNAVKYAPKKSRVTVSVRATDEGAVIGVDDEGPGIPDDIKETIFEMYARDESSPQWRSRGEDGSGIGLYLVSEFARAHGGRAWVEDGVERGASFRVFLPSATPAGDPKTPA